MKPPFEAKLKSPLNMHLQKGMRRIVKVYGPVRDPRLAQRIEAQKKQPPIKAHSGLVTSVKDRIDGQL